MDFLVTNDCLRSYAGKRVFVTGHTGFKGAWLTYLLTLAGADVTGYALAPAFPRGLFSLLGLRDAVRHIEADVRDAEALADAVANAEPEFVFHLAAQALVGTAYADPQATFATNVLGTVNMCEAVRNSPSVRALVCVTSDKCYENKEWVWGYRETDALGGADPYSASKAAAELAFDAYQRSYYIQRESLGAATVRAGNVIGGGDWSLDRLVPDCIRAIEAGEPIRLRRPQATRPWQHVLEPVSAYMLLGARLFERPRDYRGAWNFGPSSNDPRTVRQVVDQIARAFGRGDLTVGEETHVHHEAMLLQLNCDKAAQLLGWRPRWGTDQAVAATVDWYRHVVGGGDAAGITQRQIQQYFG